MAKNTNGNQTLQTQETHKQEVEPIEGTERTYARKAYVPRADIYETDDAIMVATDMPGVDENSIDIVLEKNILKSQYRALQKRNYIEPKRKYCPQRSSPKI